MYQSMTRFLGSATVFVEAFGSLSPPPHTNGLINAEEEDLYSVFRARSVLMSWYSEGRATERPMAWHMHEAEITADDENPGPHGSRIAYAQVGLEHHAAELMLRLPALIQCFHDAVRRFGDINLSAIQVTAVGLTPDPPSCLINLISSDNWFNTATDTRANAIITFDHETLSNHTETKPFSRFQKGIGGGGLFTFGPLTKASESQRIAVPAETPYFPNTQPSDTALPVTLPEWTPGAIGWAIAAAVDGVRTASPELEHVIVRITRTD